MTAKADLRGRARRIDRGAAVSGLAALGIVYGDIGTSPLYAFKVAVQAARRRGGSAAAIGVASLIIWSLILVVSIKYAVADPARRQSRRGRGRRDARAAGRARCDAADSGMPRCWCSGWSARRCSMATARSPPRSRC